MTDLLDPAVARQFAVEVVERLRAAGFQALWAGGCVRDQLLNISPKDYDVATNATPDQVRNVFGHRRTHAVGAAFGVITVLGRPGAGQIEVATFRRDATYSDGRHPDAVTFSNAEEDAQRRDFTINGLFFDPIAKEVIDYVGGQDDLRAGIIRAIRDPAERFGEDKLRMLRAVRFAATFGFAIEPQTLSAIQRFADELVIVSAERIAAEMRRMLVHTNRRHALELLDQTGLLSVILPESVAFGSPNSNSRDEFNVARWQRTLAILERLNRPTFSVALAALVRELCSETEAGTRVETLCERWRLSNVEKETSAFLLGHEQIIRNATRTPWCRLQRVLIMRPIQELLTYAESVAAVLDDSTAEIDFCRAKLLLPVEELNPLPLLTGDDLKRAGIQPGPQFRLLLEAVRDEQLERRIATQAEALALAQRLAANHQPGT